MWERVRLVSNLFGDSVHRGYLSNGGGVRAVAYPEVLIRDYFDKLYGVGEVLVSTRAVDGTHSGMLVAGTDGLNPAWPQAVNADIAIINHGVNDASHITAGLWSQAQYIAALRTLSVAPAKVIFQTPTPVNNSNPNLAPQMRSVASSTGTTMIDVRAYIDTVSGWYTNYAPDGIHLNDAGYQLVYTNSILPQLKTIMDQITGRTV